MHNSKTKLKFSDLSPDERAVYYEKARYLMERKYIEADKNIDIVAEMIYNREND